MAAAAAGDQSFGHGQPPTPERPRRFSMLSFTVGGMTGVAACLAAVGIASMALRDGDSRDGVEQIETAADLADEADVSESAIASALALRARPVLFDTLGVTHV